MNRRRLLRLARSLIVIAPLHQHLVASEPVNYADLLERSKQAQTRGHYDEAEAIIRKGLAMLTRPECHDGLVLENELGHVHEIQGRFTEAETEYRKALALNAQSEKPDEQERAVSLNNLGTIALLRGSLTEAQAQVRESAAILERAGLAESHLGGLVLLNLCNIGQQREEFTQARGLCAHAESVILRDPGGRSLDYAKVLVSEALLSFRTGDFRDSLAKGRRGLAIENQLEFVDPLHKAITEQNLAWTLIRLGEFPEAEKLIEDAVTLYRSEPTQQRTGLPDALSSLASVETRMNNLAAAEENATAGLRLADPGSDIAARLHSALGSIELRRKNWNNARRNFEQSMLILQRLKRDQTTEYAAGFVNLGTLYDRTGKHKLAESHYRAALAIHEARLGSQHPQVAEDFANLAAQIYARKQFDQAEELYDQAKAINEKVYGPDTAQVAVMWRNIGVVRESAKRLADSQQAYSRAVAAYSLSNAANGEEFATCLREYAVLLRRLERFHEAENADLQATRIQVRNAILASKSGRADPDGLTFR